MLNGAEVQLKRPHREMDEAFCVWFYIRPVNLVGSLSVGVFANATKYATTIYITVARIVQPSAPIALMRSLREMDVTVSDIYCFG